SAHRVAESRRQASAGSLVADRLPDHANDRMGPNRLYNTCQPSATSTPSEVSKLCFRLAVPRQSRTTAGVLLPVLARTILKPTGLVTRRGATPVSPFPSSRHAASVHPSRRYRRPSANNPTNAAFLAGTRSAGQAGQNADRHVPTARGVP